MMIRLKVFLQFRKPVIDDFVFRLHKITFICLVVLGISLAYWQLYGHPVKCTSRNVEYTDIEDNYCFLHSTHSIEEAWGRRVSEEVPYPGLDKYTPGESRIYHTYYQWVPVFLLIQAFLFFVPRYFWKTMETGRIKHMLEDLFRGVNERPVEKLADDIGAEFGLNGEYFFLYFVAELMNAANVIGQIFLMKAFLGIESIFWNPLSHSVIDSSTVVSADSSLRIFPAMTWCMFYTYASSGDVMMMKSLCLLTMNIFNRKMFACLFIWFFILAILSTLMILHDILILLFPRYRCFLLNFRARSISSNAKELGRVCTVSDWFLLYLLSKNLSSPNFRKLVNILSQQLTK